MAAPQIDHSLPWRGRIRRWHIWTATDHRGGRFCREHVRTSPIAINSRPQRDDQQDRSDFLSRATAEDTSNLQCWIPADLHHELKVQAVDGPTNAKVLVVEALQNYRREREA